MRRIDPAFEEAASICGASRGSTMLRINLPLLRPAILGAATYVFMTAISMFEVPALLGAGQGRNAVLATEMFYSALPKSAFGGIPRYGAGGVYGVLIAIPCLIGLYFYFKVLRESHRYAVIAGKGYRPRRIGLGRWNAAALGFAFLHLLLAVVLPLLALVWISLLPGMRTPSADALRLVSLRQYERLPAYMGIDVVQNTALLIVSVAAVATVLSLLISWVVVRTRARFRRIMDTLAMLPHAIPGLGFAFALLLLGILVSKYFPWLPLFGTIGVIVIAHTLNRLPYSTRLTNAALLQVSAELEESARVCGAGVLVILRRVLVPIIRPSLVFAALWTALLSFREVTMALLLGTPDNRVAAVTIWLMWEVGELSQAAAGAVAMVIVGAVLATIALAFGEEGAQERALR
jgi:iron(III) transport system permease protein